MKTEEKKGRGRPKKIIPSEIKKEEKIEEIKEEKIEARVIIDETPPINNNKDVEVESIYIIDWVYRSDLTTEEKEEIEKEEKYYRIPRVDGLGYIYDCDKDTAVYMIRYLIKWIFGSRELWAIIIGNIMNIAIIVLLLIAIIMTAMKPSLNAIKGVIPIANNSQIIKKEIKENNIMSWAIIQ